MQGWPPPRLGLLCWRVELPLPKDAEVCFWHGTGGAHPSMPPQGTMLDCGPLLVGTTPQRAPSSKTAWSLGQAQTGHPRILGG